MAYIIGLFIILGLVFSSGLGSHTDFLSAINPVRLLGLTELKNKTIEIINSKSEKEKLIINIKNNEEIIEKFLTSETTKKLLQSSSLSSQDKEIITKAATAVQQAKQSISKLQEAIKSDKNITREITSKILDFTKKSDSSEPGPTYIPPQCKMVCSN